jgi:HEAT repeat protein
VFLGVAAALAQYRISGSVDQSLPTLRQALNDASLQNRRAAVHCLGKIGLAANPALVELSKCLKDQEPDMRVRAALAAYTIGANAEDVLSVVLAGLKDKETRFLATEAVRVIGPKAKAAVPLLREWVRSGEKDALQALGCIGAEAKDAVPDLITALRSRDLRNDAVDALRNIGPAAADAVPALARLLDDPDLYNLVDALKEFGPAVKPGIPILRKFLISPDRQLAERAAQTLGSLSAYAEDAIPDLIMALEQKEIRASAAHSLGRFGARAKKAIPALVLGMKSDDKAYRLSATFALVNIAPKHEGLYDALMEERSASNGLDETRVISSLGALGPRAKAAVPDLLILLKSDGSNFLRAVAAQSLIKIDPRSSVVHAALQEALKDKAVDIRVGAAKALCLHSPAPESAIRVLTESLEVGKRVYRMDVARTLIHLGKQEQAAMKLLLAELKGDSSGKGFAIRIFGELGPKAMAAVPALREVERNSYRYRREASQALAKIQASETARD